MPQFVRDGVLLFPNRFRRSARLNLFPLVRPGEQVERVPPRGTVYKERVKLGGRRSEARRRRSPKWLKRNRGERRCAASAARAMS